MAQRYLIKRLKLISMIITAPLLILCISLSVQNLIKTYADTERAEREVMWQIVQLNKEIGHILYTGETFLNGHTSLEHLRRQYDLTWSRFPILLYNKSLLETTTDVEAVAAIFDVFKLADSTINSDEPNAAFLHAWLDDIFNSSSSFTQFVSKSIMDDDTAYSHFTSGKLMNALSVLGTFVFGFIVYLGFLIRILWSEYQSNQYLLQHDSLTGLASRDFTMHTINAYCQKQQDFSLISFDLNKFKRVNDTYGHHAGDLLLAHLAKQFKIALKDPDSTNLVGRIGGDEFLWICDATDKHSIERLHQKLLKQLETPYPIGHELIQLKLSAGAAPASGAAYCPAMLMEQVDVAMYAAKQHKQSTVRWSGTEASPRARALCAELTAANKSKSEIELELAR
jgi:diguanylate cyclase (GGDEF)-like protein